MMGNLHRGLLAGLAFLFLGFGFSGCTSVHKDEVLVHTNDTPVFRLEDPATERFSDDARKIRLVDWNAYRAFPQRIVVPRGWSTFIVVLCENEAPKITYSWRDAAAFLADRDSRARLHRVYVYTYQEMLPYFLSKGDSLNADFVKMAVFTERGDGLLVRLDRDQYRQTHYPNKLAVGLSAIGLRESDPTLDRDMEREYEWLPQAPRSTPQL